MRSSILFLLIWISFSSCGISTDEYKNYDRSLPHLIDSLQINKDRISILIDKSDYKLSILIDSLILKEYPVVFGGNPTDDKRMQGDQCTPEGSFKIISKYPHKDWSKFIWINYPNEESWKKHKKSKQDGLIPEDADIGGEIGIHGVPNDLNKLIDRRINWTLGCVEVKNEDVNEIYPYINENIIIEIVK